MSEPKKTINFPGVDLSKIVPPAATEAALELESVASELKTDPALSSWILVTSDGSGNLNLLLSKRFPGSVSRLQEAMGKLDMAKSIILSVLQQSLREGADSPLTLEETPDA